MEDFICVAFVPDRNINLKKDVKKAIASLKQIDEKMRVMKPLDLDLHLLSAIKVVREVGVVRSSVYRSLLLFLSGFAPKPKASRWSLVQKMIQKGTTERHDLLGLTNKDLLSWRPVEAAQSFNFSIVTTLVSISAWFFALRIFFKDNVYSLTVLRCSDIFS
ncbi:hypothetical protein Tco_0565328 [Tanacetum coccineum]